MDLFANHPNNNPRLRFRISATNALSNHSEIFEQEYTLNDLENGDFIVGPEFDID
jgi:hypothetical protein